MPIKISTTGYVTIKLFHFFGEKCIPTGKTRIEADGDVAAEFILISGNSTERKVWLKRTDIY